MLKFVFGTVVGAAIALMLAPKSGEELREDLSDRANDLSDRVNDSIERGKDAARKVSRRARELGEQAHEQLHNVTDAV
jgi:gas vesicle protein